MAMNATDEPKPIRLHFHVCVHCAVAFRREGLEGRLLLSGIIICPVCGLEGPLKVQIRESVKRLLMGKRPVLLSITHISVLSPAGY
jgi:hypothetical protein